MIRPINISPLDIATQVYFDCGKCGVKETVTIDMISIDKQADLEELKNIPCPNCGVLLGVSGLPKLDGPEIEKLAQLIFNKQDVGHPANLYMHLLFDGSSPNAQSKKFSERIESLSQFITKGKKGMIDGEGTIPGIIFSKTLKYLLAEGYITQEEYGKEYDSCMLIWEKYFNSYGQ